jgi:GTP pyrophosphokinase
MVMGVTKLSKLDFPSKELAQIETYRKMVLAMARDMRVIIIKLADRLHNMRTLGSMKPEAQVRIAEETMAIYAPIAHRLGINRLKAELEDMAFAVLQPQAYARVLALVESAERDRIDRLESVGLALQLYLAEHEIEAEVTGRVKHLYSVYRKMQSRGRAFDQITDIVALRVIVGRVHDCYAALGLIHLHWQAIPGRFKDYITMPKLNGYQSLHTTVYTDERRPLEIQIRTREMHREAEYGIAAHYEYKDGSPTARSTRIARERRTTFLDDLSSEADASTEEFYAHLLDHLAGEEEVYVYTPRGDVKVLPKGATPIDFAYAVHTDLGHTCVGARVNGRPVSFAYQLRSGDHVEVIGQKGSSPSRDWLRLAVTPRALGKIRAFHAQSDRAETEARGRRELARALRKSRLGAETLNGPEIVGVVDDMGYRRASDFYVAIGTDKLSTAAVIRHLRRRTANSSILPRLWRAARSARIVDELGREPSTAWQLARCCNPMPGDPIIGLAQDGRALQVHRLQCPQAEEAESALRALAWQLGDEATAPSRVVIQGDNRPGLLEDVSAQVAAHGGNIMSHSGTSRDGAFSLILSVELDQDQSMARMLAAIRSISGVFDAFVAES